MRRVGVSKPYLPQAGVAMVVLVATWTRIGGDMTLIFSVLAITAIPLLVAVLGAIVPQSPSRRRDALRALELLVRRR